MKTNRLVHSSVTQWCIAASLLVLLGACAKQAAVVEPPKPASVTLVSEPERSKHFDPVTNNLELGGTLYAYADVDGDVLSLAAPIQSFATGLAQVQPQLQPLAKLDYRAIMIELGLDDVKAVGLSSIHQTDGLYRNRTFLYTPAGRHGLFAVFGGAPGPFVGTTMAPADTDLYSEHEFDMAAVYDTIKSVVGKVQGPEAADKFEAAVKKAGDSSHFSVFDMIQGLNGRATLILRLDPTKNIAITAARPVNVPDFSALVRVDGIGPALEASLVTETADFDYSAEGTLHLFTCKDKSPIEGLKLVIAVQGKALFIATSPDFLRECLNRTQGLNKNPQFVSALADLGPNGNGITWVTPRFYARLKEIAAINAQAEPNTKRIFDLYAASIPVVSQPILAVRTNLPDGILIRSIWNRSLKTNVAMITVYNPFTVGLMAAMAIPAFQKVRLNSQTMAVTNNLRMLSAAADQYYLEHGVRTATFKDLVGPEPGKYIKVVTSVAGEDYSSLIFMQNRPVRVRLPDGRTYSYPPVQPRPYNQMQRVTAPTPTPVQPFTPKPPVDN